MDIFAPIAGRRPPTTARNERMAVAGIVAGAFAFAASCSVFAAEGGETMLIRRGDAVITRADVDQELLRLPEERRAELLNSEQHVVALLDRLLVARELAARARARKLDAGLQLEGHSALEQERMLAAAWMATVEEAAGRDFDAKHAVWERRARELYLSERAQYTIPEMLIATQIVFSANRGGSDDAGKRASAAAARLAGGADFAALALALSDEPDVAQTRGRVGPVERGRLSPAIDAAVFALRQPGEVTPPIESPAGWHLFRLEERRGGRVQPFDEVSAAILARLRSQELERARSGVLAELRTSNPNVTVNEPALRAMKTLPDAARGPTRMPGFQPAPPPR
jgi:parvulin-like peptidyl-prolyl isomerase